MSHSRRITQAGSSSRVAPCRLTARHTLVWMHRSHVRVVVATSEGFEDLDESWPLLARALEDDGCGWTLAAWNDPAINWSACDAVLVNYAWGYVAARDAFVSWAAEVQKTTVLVNAYPVLEWNSAKTYLGDLEADGVPIVPTTFVPPGEAWRAPDGDFVIKPAVANGGLGAARYATRQGAAHVHVRRLHEQGQTVLVQPYQRRVDQIGETALVYIGGDYSHAVTKQPLLRADVGVIERLYEQHQIAPVAPRPEQLDAAERALSAAQGLLGTLGYCRVDLVDDDEGRPLLLELEAVEPALYLPDLAVARRLARQVRMAAT